jgi:hypothetical protein
MDKRAELNAEKKLLIAIYTGEVFEGPTLRQEKPACCGRVIDLYAADVAFREIAVGKKVFNLLEPRCPSCGKRIPAVYSFLN